MKITQKQLDSLWSIIANSLFLAGATPTEVGRGARSALDALLKAVPIEVVSEDEGVGVPRCPVSGGWCSTCRIGGRNGSGGVCARRPFP